MYKYLVYGTLFLAGGGLGFLYYGGLWMTVNRLGTSNWPGVLTVISFIVRTAFVAFLFLWLMQGSATRLLVMLFGFILVRLVLVRYLGTGERPGWLSVLRGDFSP